MVSGRRTSAPSTTIVMPPKASSERPVAVTTTSASSSAPDASRIPVEVKVSTWSVTTSARPSRMTWNRSPSGTRHSRWSHGSYAGRKCRSTSYPSGSRATTALRISFFISFGCRRLSW